jgi:hypothetical protein
MNDYLGNQLGDSRGFGSRRFGSLGFGSRFAHRALCFWYQSLGTSRALGSRAYRIGHFVEELPGATTIIGSRLPLDRLGGTRVLSCLRPLVNASTERTLAALARRGVTLVADFDDLLFAGPVSGVPETLLRRSGFLSSEPVHARYARALEVFDRFTVSTAALAERLADIRPGAAITVVPNGLSRSWVNEGLALSRGYEPGQARVIRYFAGSPTHDCDLATIAAPLAAFLHRYPEVRLEVVGFCNLDLSAFPAERVTRVARVPFRALPELYASAWVALAPLAQSEYNACRSANKVLEAGVFGCPCLASPNGDVERHVAAGARVLVCREEVDWYDALARLLDEEERMAVGQSLQSYALRHGMAAQSVRRFREVFLGEAQA